MNVVHPPLAGVARAGTDAAATFRAALDCMASPGRIARLAGAAPPAPASPAAGALLLTLCDASTPLHLAGRHNCTALAAWVERHTGAPLTDRAGATFALGTWGALLPLEDYTPGTEARPDLSATLIVELPRLAAEGTRLAGPGIRGAARLSLPALAPFAANAARFPLGLDFFLVCGESCASLPRSTRVERG